MHHGKRQPDAPDAARLCLLDLLEALRNVPETLPVAPLSNRHAAVASRQARRHFRRKEDEYNGDPASLMSAPEPHPPPVGRSRTAVPRLTPKS